jgi:hypothetical protein
VVGIFLTAHKHGIANFKIAEFRSLPIFAELCAAANLDGHCVSGRLSDLDGLVMHRGQFAEKPRTPIAAAPRRLRRVRALGRGGILRGRSFLR